MLKLWLVHYHLQHNERLLQCTVINGLTKYSSYILVVMNNELLARDKYLMSSTFLDKSARTCHRHKRKLLSYLEFRNFENLLMFFSMKAFFPH